MTLLKGPRLQIRNNSGGIVTPGAGQPVLVNLFASWCPACVVELTEFRDREVEIRAAGIEIISLSVDGLGEDSSTPEAAKQLLERLDYPFASAMASSELLTNLQEYHNALVSLHRPLPLPSSFLIDADGRVSVMYKGPVEVGTLLEDARQTNSSRAERWTRGGSGSRASDPTRTRHGNGRPHRSSDAFPIWAETRIARQSR